MLPCHFPKCPKVWWGFAWWIYLLPTSNNILPPAKCAVSLTKSMSHPLTLHSKCCKFDSIRNVYNYQVCQVNGYFNSQIKPLLPGCKDCMSQDEILGSLLFTWWWLCSQVSPFHFFPPHSNLSCLLGSPLFSSPLLLKVSCPLFPSGRFFGLCPAPPSCYPFASLGY